MMAQWTLKFYKSIIFFLLILSVTHCVFVSSEFIKKESVLPPKPITENVKKKINFQFFSPQVIPGSVIRLKGLFSIPCEKITGEFEKHSLLFYDSHAGDPLLSEYECHAFVGIAYEHVTPSVGHVIVCQPAEGKDPECVENTFDIIPGQYPSEVLKVDGRRVVPKKPADIKRIQLEQEELQTIYHHIFPQPFWDHSFTWQWPLVSHITSAFGTQRLYNGFFKNYHTGVDLRAAIGTSVYPCAPGKVVLAKDLFFTGKTVIIAHGVGLISLYAHLNDISVSVNQIVTSNNILGFSGKTGRVTGPHLHWQTMVHGIKVNPLSLF